MRVRFHDFVFDTDRRELWHGMQPLHLPPKAFQLLQILIEQRPRAVSQQELHDTLWPTTFVESSGLHNLIYQIREALEDHDQTIVRTAYGFGFSFAADAVEDRPHRTTWQIVVGDNEFDLHEGENIVGRQRDVTVPIESSCISRHHARLVVHEDAITIEDLGSKNGTFVGGHRIRSVDHLDHDEKILFGTIAATLRRLDPAADTETAR